MFDPYGILSINQTKIIYVSYEVHDIWGDLTVKNGVLVNVDVNSRWLTLGPPIFLDERSAKGNGWELNLKPGWKLVKENRSFSLKALANTE